MRRRLDDGRALGSVKRPAHLPLDKFFFRTGRMPD
jgi:hypothetical protein